MEYLSNRLRQNTLQVQPPSKFSPRKAWARRTRALKTPNSRKSLYHIAFLVPRGRGGAHGAQYKYYTKDSPLPFSVKKLIGCARIPCMFRFSAIFTEEGMGGEDFHRGRHGHFETKNAFLQKKGERVFWIKKKGSSFHFHFFKALFGENSDKAEPARYSGAAAQPEASRNASDKHFPFFIIQAKIMKCCHFVPN